MAVVLRFWRVRLRLVRVSQVQVSPGCCDAVWLGPVTAWHVMLRWGKAVEFWFVWAWKVRSSSGCCDAVWLGPVLLGQSGSGLSGQSRSTADGQMAGNFAKIGKIEREDRQDRPPVARGVALLGFALLR